VLFFLPSESLFHLSSSSFLPVAKMSLTIYALHWSQSDRIVWLCEELKTHLPTFTYELVLLDRSFTTPNPGKTTLLSLHPTGTSPTITDSTVSPPITISESQAILTYILEVHGGSAASHLRPAPPVSPQFSPQAYATYNFWLSFANGSFQPAVSNAIYAFSLTSTPNFPTELLESNPAHQSFAAKLPHYLSVYESQLQSSPYLCGSEFSAADIMNIYALTLERLIYPIDLTAYPGIVAWLGRVTRRKAYRRTMEVLEDGFPAVCGAVAPRVSPQILLGLESWRTVEKVVKLREEQDREDAAAVERGE
jgi:glutathione S-transferase